MFTSARSFVCHPWLARGGRPCNLCEMGPWGLVSVDIVNSLLLFSLGFLSVKIHVSEKWLWSYKLEVNRQRYLGRLSSLSTLARPQSSPLIMFLAFSAQGKLDIRVGVSTAVCCARNGMRVEQAIPHSCFLPCVKSCLIWSLFMDCIRNGRIVIWRKRLWDLLPYFLF